MQLVHSALKSKYSANCREKKLILAYLVSSHYLYCTILQFLEHCVYISDQKVKNLQNNVAAQLWQLFPNFTNKKFRKQKKIGKYVRE